MNTEIILAFAVLVITILGLRQGISAPGRHGVVRHVGAAGVDERGTPGQGA
jgi:hypothetical protein